jgi:hypothetical protein
MPLPRHGQLDDRRRRVLTEEVMGSRGAMAEPSPDSASRSSSTTRSRRRRLQPARSYGDDVLIDRQPRVTDLLPQSYGMLALLLFAGFTLIVGLEAAYLWLPEVSAMTSDGQFAMLDLENEGALANWFSSMTLGLASVVAAIIYSVRRHRQDDYHGRYRVWLWVSALWMLMSIDEAASLHEGLTQIATHFSGEGGFGGGSIWWVSAYGLIFAALGTRLLLEMRGCRLSSTVLMVAIGCFTVAVAVKIGFVTMVHGPYAVMAEEGCEMVGDVLLLMAMLVHARYTILDAQGAIAAKGKRAAKAKTEKAASKKDSAPSTDAPPGKRSWFRHNEVDAAHNSPPAPSAKMLENSKSSKASTAKAAGRPLPSKDDEGEEGATRTGHKHRADEADNDYDYEVDRRLSKAERKALRRQRDRQRHEDA